MGTNEILGLIQSEIMSRIHKNLSSINDKNKVDAEARRNKLKAYAETIEIIITVRNINGIS